MRELKDNKLFDGYKANGAPLKSKYNLICTPSGGIVYADDYIKDLSGCELSGRNIGSFADLRFKADLISAYNDGQIYRSSTVIFDRRFSVTAFPEGKYITISLSENDSGYDGVLINEKDYEGLSSEIRSALYSIIGMMRDPEFKGNARVGAARKDFFRTYKTINAILEKISFENELDRARAQKCDIDGICRAIIDKISEYGDGYKVEFGGDGAEHFVIADKHQLDKALVALFICLYNCFGYKRSKISVFVKLDSGKVILRVSAQNVSLNPNYSDGKAGSNNLPDEGDFLNKEELFAAKKLLSDNGAILSSLKEKDKTYVSVSFDSAKSEPSDLLKFNDTGRVADNEAIDSMLLFELGETLCGDDI